MNSKMTTNTQLSAIKPKNKTKQNKTTNKLSKHLEQEHNHRNGDHMEGHQQGGGWERLGEKAQVIRSINGRYEIDRRRLRVVWEMEKPKNLYV